MAHHNIINLPGALTQGPDGRTRRWFSYADVEAIALAQRRAVMARNYCAIVALARGGIYLATMLSQMTDIAHAVAYYDRATSGVQLFNLPPAQNAPRRDAPRVLLVEDVAGKGHTLARVKDCLLRQGYAVDVMVICWDSESRIEPDYGIRLPDGESCLFPWERSQLAPTDPGRRANDADLANWTTAFDLDGVFVRDLPESAYLENLAGALAARDALPPLPPHPYWRDGDLIVSARLEVDRERTLAWLDRHGLAPSRLVLRPSLAVPPTEFKRQALLSLSVTEYIESEFPIAAGLAALPHVVVWHYDCEKGENRLMPYQVA